MFFFTTSMLSSLQATFNYIMNLKYVTIDIIVLNFIMMLLLDLPWMKTEYPL